MYRVVADFHDKVEDKVYRIGDVYPVKDQERAAYLAALGFVVEEREKGKKKDEQPEADLG